MKWFDDSNLRPVDILCICDANCWISTVIRWGSDGMVNHIALYLGDGFIVDASMNGVQIRPLAELDGKYSVLWAVRMLGLTDDQKKGIIKFCEEQVGAKYDFIQLAGIWLALFLGASRSFYDEHRKYVCSELIGEAFASQLRLFTHKRDPSCVTPQDIFASDNVSRLL